MIPYYYSLNEYLQDTYGYKLYKLALNGGMTCPNRDGRIDTRGCIFCSAGGSGDFTGDALMHKSDSVIPSGLSSYSTSISNTVAFSSHTVFDIDIQIEAAKQLVSKKYNQNRYIAYFQSYTNTYGNIDYLRTLFTSVINRPDICILSIATRPDCLDAEVIQLLGELNQIKPVWIELGLQTIHEATASYIRRGYPLFVFDTAVKQLIKVGISPIIHMIIGLPGETPEMMLETADYIGHCGASGIKLQLLHVLKETDLAKDYNAGLFQTIDMETYIQYLGNIIEILPKDMVIHRLTGDGPKNLLIAPAWSANKKKVLNSITQYFKDNNICQGRNYK